MVVTYVLPNISDYLDKIFDYLRHKGYDLSRMKPMDIVCLMEQYRTMPDFPTTKSTSGVKTTGVVVGSFKDYFFVAREDGRIVKVPIEDCYIESF